MKIKFIEKIKKLFAKKNYGTGMTCMVIIPDIPNAIEKEDDDIKD